MVVWAYALMLGGGLLLVGGLSRVFAGVRSRPDERWAEARRWLNVSMLGGALVFVSYPAARLGMQWDLAAVLAGVPVGLFALGSAMSQVKRMRWLGLSFLGLQVALVSIELAFGIAALCGEDLRFRPGG